MYKYSSKYIFDKLALFTISLVILTGILIRVEQKIFYYTKDTSSKTYAMELGPSDVYFENETGIDHEEVSAKIDSLKVDPQKVARIRTFFAQRGSPLASQAEYFVKAAEQYGIDYRLVAAISIIESSGGKYPYRPYNAWGWGGQGSAFRFSSWKEGIYTVSRGLSHYYATGARTPQQIGRRYNPESWREWARKVALVIDQI